MLKLYSKLVKKLCNQALLCKLDVQNVYPCVFLAYTEIVRFVALTINCAILLESGQKNYELCSKATHRPLLRRYE